MLFVGGTAPGQVEWDTRWPVLNRGYHAMTYDTARQRIVLFGGERTPQVLGDTWEWDGADWQQRSPATSPPARAEHGMAYDSGRGVVVLFGGRDASGRGLNDTWEWDGTTWTQRTGGSAPQGRWGHFMTYDPVRAVTIIASAKIAPGSRGYDELWEWDGHAWRFGTYLPPLAQGVAYDSGRRQTILTTIDILGSAATWKWDGSALQQLAAISPGIGMMFDDVARGRVVFYDAFNEYMLEWDGTTWLPRTPASTPGRRMGGAIAYDVARAKALLVSGVGLFDAWEWDGLRWTELEPLPSPSARVFHGLSYDIGRGRTVLFGGSNGYNVFSDTWEWDGIQWVLLSPTRRPQPRAFLSLVYMESSTRSILFGGSFAPGPGNTLSDTWEWDGNNWTQRLPLSSPPSRDAHAMAYDSDRQVVVLFGGSDWATYYRDTWEWNGNNWTQRVPRESPSARTDHAMAYDVARNRVVLFGGSNGVIPLGDTWEWDGSDWIFQAPTTNPAARAGHGMTYDSSRGRVVLFGGNSLKEDTWEWDGTNWHARTVANPPPGQAGAPLVYDAGRREVLMFNGDDTWFYRPTNRASYTLFGAGCPGTAGSPALAAPPNQYPWLATTLTVDVSNLPPGRPVALTLGSSKTNWGPLTLPVPLNFLGMTGCVMYASGELAIPLANPSGTATWTLNVPNDPSIVAAKFYNQAYVFDPLANPFGMTVSNAAEGVVGAK